MADQVLKRPGVAHLIDKIKGTFAAKDGSADEVMLGDGTKKALADIGGGGGWTPNGTNKEVVLGDGSLMGFWELAQILAKLANTPKPPDPKPIYAKAYASDFYYTIVLTTSSAENPRPDLGESVVKSYEPITPDYSSMSPGWTNDYRNRVDKIIIMEPILAPKSIAYWFLGVQYIEGLENLFTSETTNMYAAFMSYKGTSLDLSHLDTSNVTNMESMFSSCASQELIVAGFDTSNVTNMSNMFSSCSTPNLDLTAFNTSNVTNMAGMFTSCKCEELDLSNFDVSAITTEPSSMFYRCSDLKTIYCDKNWAEINPIFATARLVFTNCSKLVGAVPYSSTNVGGDMCNPDTGYFTRPS